MAVNSLLLVHVFEMKDADVRTWRRLRTIPLAVDMLYEAFVLRSM